MSNKCTRHSYWNLYWVESDGYEDCFIVARNSRSARRIEKEVNSFEDNDFQVTKIMQIPKKVEIFYKRSKDYKLSKWPYYVYGKDFFKKLGAKFRMVDDQEQMLLKDIVYEVDD